MHPSPPAHAEANRHAERRGSMSTVTRVTVFFLTAAMAIATACKDEPPQENTGLTFPPGWTPPSLDPPEAGPKRPPASAEGWLVVDPGAEKLALVSQAMAKLEPTDGYRVEGMMWFTTTSDGLRVKVDIKNLAFMSRYTVRVHLLGDCSSKDAMSAGPAFNFQGSSLAENGPETGVIGELQAAVEGDAKGETIAPAAALQGHYSIIGRSLVLHAKPDGTSKSPDPLGPRIACGVIGIRANADALATPLAPEAKAP